jgi:hypothetical protein
MAVMHSDPPTTPHEQGARRPLLVTSSPDQAEDWATILNEAGVDALVEITDAQIGDPGGSPLIGALGMRPAEFVYLVTIPPPQRDLAVGALLEAGWDGREGLRGGRGSLGPGSSNVRQMVIAGVCTVLGVGAFVLIRIATT